MSSNGFATPLRIERQPSLQLATCLILAHGVAVCVLPFIAIAALFKVLVLLAIVLSLIANLRRHAWLVHPRAVRNVVMRAHDDWWLEFRDGSEATVELLGDTYIHPLLTILNFRDGHTRRSVVLAPDGAHPDVLRRLRVHLRWSGGQGKETRGKMQEKFTGS